MHLNLHPPPFDLQQTFMWSIAGLRPAMLHMKPVETQKAGISRVCVKASPAFGRRRLCTDTDNIVFGRGGLWVPRGEGGGGYWMHVHWMKLRLDESVFGRKCFWMKTVLDEPQRNRDDLLSLTELKDLKEWSMCRIILTVFPQTSNLLVRKRLLYAFEDNQAVIKMIIKGRSPTMRHVSRTHRVWIGCSIESTWTQQSKSSTSTPKTNSQTCWPSEISHVMSGIICCTCSISAISVLQCALIQWRNDLNTIQGKNESQQNRDQWLLLQGRRRTCHPRLQ